MNTRPQALRLADALEMDKWHITGVTAQQAADELRRLHNEILVYHDDRLKLSNEVDRLKAAQPAPVQEPVAYVVTTEVHGQMCSFIHRIDLTKLLPDDAMLYTNPSATQRQWFGLTEEEINNCCDFPLNSLGMKHVRKIEAKLKEKNGV
jgi:hypothetical protein